MRDNAAKELVDKQEAARVNNENFQKADVDFKSKEGIAAQKKNEYDSAKSEYEKARKSYDAAVGTPNMNDEISQQRYAAEDKMNKLKKENEDAISNLQTAKTARDKLSTDKAGADALVETAKKNLDDLEKSAGYQKSQIIEKYDLLSKANTQQQGEIGKNRELADEVKNMQKDANKKYGVFLDAKRDLELCMVDVNAEKNADKKKALTEACKPKEDAMTAAGEAVRKVLADLTAQEQINNRNYTFPVSKMLNLKGGKAAAPTVKEVVNKVGDWMITLVGSLAVTTLIIGGIILVTSAGNEERLTTGKTIFSYSLIGVVVTLLAYGIVAFIQSLFFTI